MARRLVVLAVFLVVAGSACGSSHEVKRRAVPGHIDVATTQDDVHKVVYTADLLVRVDDTVRAAERASEIVGQAGGFVFAQSSDLNDRKQALLTLKVPPARFDSVLSALGGLGRALKRDVKAQDVTEQVVDVEGRLKTAETSADRLRGLLASATSTGDVVAVETELAKRESEIESLTGRLRVLNAQVDLATIDLRLTEHADVRVNGEIPGFLRALRAGWVTLVNVLAAVVAAAGFLVPFAPFAVLGGWVVRHRRRRRRQRRVAGPDQPLTRS